MFSEGLGEFVIRPTVEAEVFRINRPDRSIQRLPTGTDMSPEKDEALEVYLGI